ncbi:MAG: minichromosome maintenance protein MCM [Candidatus Thalassarchaeaceae archaeon]|jgi:replicative DNA helicase Mcm|nr:minichromosome maintenance protein MCM [Candidatus Thalassarchaeaceae archaeon]HJM87434.1 minichromosome maintenance protein MCM [Candidatus Thalassarchaeaceae archaeon]
MVGIQDSNARWRTFLQEQYSREIQVLASAWPNQNVMLVTFAHIQAWDPNFAQALIEYPKPILRAGSEALRSLCREGGWEIEPMLRVIELPLDCKRSLREVGSDDIDMLISSEVVVTKVSELKPRIYHALFRCAVCNHTNEVPQLNELELIEPVSCNDLDGGCGRYPSGKDGTRFELIQENVSLVDNQWIEIQELPENVTGGAQPARATVLAEADLANLLLPGMRVTVNLVPFIRTEKTRGSKTPMFNIYHTLVSAEQENIPFNEIEISEEDQEMIAEISSRADLLELMTNSIAPSIFGAGKLQMVKRSLVMQLFSGVSRKYSDGTRARGDIHILLMGDPGVAKSQLLSYMSQISPRGRYASGGGISGAGLTAAAVRDAFNDGRFSLEAGILVLADSGLAAIDEFDKMNNDDRAKMHEAMEQQKIHISKGGINATMRTRCAVLAAANPRLGRFSQRGQAGLDISPMFEEVDLPPALMSRFDIIWLIRDDAIQEQDRQIAEHILTNRSSGVSETLIEEGRMDDPRVIDDESSIKKGYSGEDQLTIPMFQKYVAWAKRNIHPVLTDEARDEIVAFYLEKRNESDGDDNSVPITARALEGLVRLAEANARMRLSQKATIEDAKRALAMFRNWRYELMGDEFDEGTILTGRSVKRRSADQTALEVIKQLSGGKRDFDINEIDILNEMSRHNFDEFEVEEALKQLSQKSQIYTPGAGRWRLVN